MIFKQIHTLLKRTNWVNIIILSACSIALLYYIAKSKQHAMINSDEESKK